MNSKAVGGPDAQTPLVIDESNRLYLRRYWNYQQRLAIALRKKAAGTKPRSRQGWHPSRGDRRRRDQRADDHIRRAWDG